MYYFKTLFFIALSMMVAMISFLFYMGSIQLFGFIMLLVATASLVWTALSFGKFIPFRIEEGVTYRLIGHTDNLLFLKKEFDGDIPVAVSITTEINTPPVISNLHIHTKNTTMYYGRILNSRKHDLHVGELCRGVRGKRRSRDGVEKILK